MKFLRNLLPIAIFALTFSSSAYADCNVDPIHFASRQRDFQAVQQYVNSKRTIPLV